MGAQASRLHKPTNDKSDMDIERMSKTPVIAANADMGTQASSPAETREHAKRRYRGKNMGDMRPAGTQG